jgi:type II secretory pathway pseudopilin PulG
LEHQQQMKAIQIARAHNDTVRAFTLTELTVILAVVVVLAGLGVATAMKNSGPTKRAQCVGNLRQFAMVTHIYCNDSSGRLPEMGTGAWVWDLPAAAADSLLARGMEKKMFYCPGTSPRFDDKLNYLNPAPNSLWNFTTSFRVIGYTAAFGGSFALTLSNQNTTIFPEQTKLNASTYLPAPPAHERPLLTDATISENLAGTAANPAPAGSFVNVPGGFMSGSLPHLSPHLNGTLPAGGNLAFKDGHVAWRKFTEMSQRASSGRGFWW